MNRIIEIYISSYIKFAKHFKQIKKLQKQNKTNKMLSINVLKTQPYFQYQVKELQTLDDMFN